MDAWLAIRLAAILARASSVVHGAAQVVQGAFVPRTAPAKWRAPGVMVGGHRRIQLVDVFAQGGDATGHDFTANPFFARGYQLRWSAAWCGPVFEAHLATHGFKVHHFAQGGISPAVSASFCALERL